MSTNQPFLRSGCPIVNGLDVFGDKWTLVIIRDLICGKETYSELANSEEKIPTNRLAERLKMLEKEGLLKKEPYQSKPKRYKYLLTEKGQDVLPILQKISKWSNKHIEGTWTPPAWFMTEPTA